MAGLRVDLEGTTDEPTAPHGRGYRRGSPVGNIGEFFADTINFSLVSQSATVAKSMVLT
jgi:hypothetical protein